MPVGFSLFYDSGSSPSPFLPTLGLSSVPDIDSGEITVDSQNNFILAATSSSFYSSGDGVHYAFTTCYVSLGPPDGPDFDFAFCDQDGKFHFNNVPLGNYRVTVFDQWNDIMVDGLSTPVGLTLSSSYRQAQLPRSGDQRDGLRRGRHRQQPVAGERLYPYVH